MQNLGAFKIRVNGKILDYRLGRDLNLDDVREFFEKKYKVDKIWSGGRHVLGVLEKGGHELFLKLATTEGIGAVTKIEYHWNEAFNQVNPRSKSRFWVPVNCEAKVYNNNLFYLITDRLEGELLSQSPEDGQASKTLIDNLEDVINFSELIQNLEIKNLNPSSPVTIINHRDWFVGKATTWFENTPESVQRKFGLRELLKIVENGSSKLEKKPRHGDFTPWHLFRLDSGQLGLIDGEHVMANSVEYYDIGYFIQRVFSVLKNVELAENILDLLKKRKYNISKLKVVLASRAIGGFLDESLSQKSNYWYAVKFRKWVLEL